MRLSLTMMGLLLLAVFGFAGAVGAPAEGQTGESADESIRLWQGWNVVVWDNQGTNFDLAFGDSFESVNAIYHWRIGWQQFARYFPDRPELSTLFWPWPNKVFWILMDEPGSLAFGTPSWKTSQSQQSVQRSVDLWEGWNVVVWEGDFATIEEAFGEDADSVGIVYYWRVDLQGYRRMLPGRPELSTIHFFEPNKVYWILMEQPGSLSFSGEAQQ